MRPAADRAVYVDFETIVAPGYGLQKLGVRQYVEDERFGVLGLAVAVGKEDVRFFWDGAPREVDSLGAARDLILTQRAAGSVLVAHNIHFESMILAKRWGITFDRMFDTAGYAAFLGIAKSLKSVAEWMGYAKLEPPAFSRASLTDLALLRKMAVYCMTDVALSREIFARAVEDATYPDIEFEIVSQTAQINLQGVAIGGTQLAAFTRTLLDRRDSEMEAFARKFRFDTSSLTKPKRVAAFLRDTCGVVVRSLDRRKSEVTDLMAAGGAAGDFLVRRARLLALSKVISRAGDYAQIRDGRAHGILRYFGAHTGRFSAGGRDSEKLNIHGLAKGSEMLGLPELGGERGLIVPPEGCLFNSADLSNIEARVVAWLAREEELLDRFWKGDDIYSWFAGLIYPDVKITKRGPNGHLRALGKEAVLGLGFGMGLTTFKRQVQAKQIPCGEEDVARAYETYVAAFPRIKALRRELFTIFKRAVNGWPAQIGLCRVRPDDRTGSGFPTVVIDLPTGRTLHYRSVRIEQELSEYGLRSAVWFAPPPGSGSSHRKNRRRFPDGVLRDRLTEQVIVENVVQAIARDIMVHQAVELERRGLPVAWHHHDEIIVVSGGCACVGDACVPGCPRMVARSHLAEVMGRLPPTLPLLQGLPIACEINDRVGATYSA